MPSYETTHEAVTQRARDIWQTRGCPDGCDTEIWLQAELQLAAAAAAVQSPAGENTRGHGNSQASTNAADPKAEELATPIRTAAKAARQKQSARAPQLPARKNAPRSKTPETGKPLWTKPHSA